MDLGKKNFAVEVFHPFAGKVTFYTRMPSDDEFIKFKHNTVKVLQTAFKNKPQTDEKKLLKKKTAIGLNLVEGLKAPEQTKSGEFKNGFALDGKPVYCNPDTGECYPDNWKELIAEKVPMVFDALAEKLCSSVYAVPEKTDDGDGEDDGDDDPAAAAGDEKNRKAPAQD